MTDAPESADAARQELDEIGQWFDDFRRRQEMTAAVQQRAAFLQGWLAAQPAAEPLAVVPEAADG